MPTKLKPGVKRTTVTDPLEWSSRTKGVRRFRAFCKRFLRVPRGEGALGAFRVRDWQMDALRDVFESPAKIHVLAIPRGNGKSALVAALALYGLYSGEQGARIVIVAQNDSAARRMLNTAARMVELSPELAERTKIYKDRLLYEATDSSIIAVASEQAAIEGEDASPFFLIDELSFVDREVYQTALASLKRKGSKLVCIGTPPTPRNADKSPFLDLVQAGRAGDPDVSLVEYAAPDGCSVNDWDAIKSANPALGDFLDVDAVRAQIPPKITEAEFRRLRLGQFVAQSGEPFIPAEDWNKQGRDVKLPPGTEVILALDGSRRWDATVLVACSVSSVPHIQPVGFWWNENRNEDYRVSHAEVEQRVMDLARIYRVKELTADPYAWSRSLQVLEDAGLVVSEFPQHGSRMPKALQEFRSAILNEKVTHSNDPTMTRHVLAAQLVEGGHGLKLDKPSKTQHIDYAVAATMAHSRAFWLATKRHKKRRVKGYKT